jgi:hypothetical protein
MMLRVSLNAHGISPFVAHPIRQSLVGHGLDNTMVGDQGSNGARKGRRGRSLVLTTLVVFRSACESAFNRSHVK